MKKRPFDSKVNLAIVVFSIFLLILGCQPEQGKLTVLPSEGVEVTTSEIDNDTAQIKGDDLTLKVSGNWSAAVLFEIDVKNSGSKELSLKFGEMNLVNGEKESATVGDITEKSDGKFIYIRHARIDGKENMEKAPAVKINPKENRRFSVVFSKPFSRAKDDEPKRTLYLTIPIETNDKPEIRSELKVVFKATE